MLSWGRELGEELCVCGMCLSQMAKRRAMKWLPNHLFPWNLLGRQTLGTRAKESLLCHSPPESLSSLSSAASCYLFSTWGRWFGGCYSGCSSLQETVDLFTDCQNLNGKEKYRRKAALGRTTAWPVTALYFSIWPSLGSAIGRNRGILVTNTAWVPICPRAYALIEGERVAEGERNQLVGRETPLAWTVFSYWHRHKLYSQMEENLKEGSCKWGEE